MLGFGATATATLASAGSGPITYNQAVSGSASTNIIVGRSTSIIRLNASNCVSFLGRAGGKTAQIASAILVAVGRLPNKISAVFSSPPAMLGRISGKPIVISVLAAAGFWRGMTKTATSQASCDGWLARQASHTLQADGNGSPNIYRAANLYLSVSMSAIARCGREAARAFHAIAGAAGSLIVQYSATTSIMLTATANIVITLARSLSTYVGIFANSGQSGHITRAASRFFFANLEGAPGIIRIVDKPMSAVAPSALLLTRIAAKWLRGPISTPASIWRMGNKALAAIPGTAVWITRLPGRNILTSSEAASPLSHLPMKILRTSANGAGGISRVMSRSIVATAFAAMIAGRYVIKSLSVVIMPASNTLRSYLVMARTDTPAYAKVSREAGRASEVSVAALALSAKQSMRQRLAVVMPQSILRRQASRAFRAGIEVGVGFLFTISRSVPSFRHAIGVLRSRIATGMRRR